MTPQVVRANVWQRTVIITLSVPADLLMNHAVVQLAVSSQNETVGSLPSESALVDVRCSCLRVPLTIRFPGITRIRSIFVQGPGDLAGVQQVQARFCGNLFGDFIVTFLADCWRCHHSPPVVTRTFQRRQSFASSAIIKLDLQSASSRHPLSDNHIVHVAFVRQFRGLRKHRQLWHACC
jgi:hypothetical protein